MRYRLFRRKSNNNYYFQFLTDDEQPILNSQGYTDKDARNNGLESVINNSGNVDRYEVITNGDGTFAFVLKAGNGQEIGRSSNYDNEAALSSAIALFQTEVPSVRTLQEEGAGEGMVTATTVVTEEKPYEADGKADNYKSLSFYESNGSAVDDGFDSFSAEGLHYFSYNLGGSVYLISEGYESTGARENGINSVTTNMSNEARYQRAVHTNGKHYFNLRAGNNREIATSRWFDSLGEMNSVIARMIAGLGLAGKSVEEGTQLEAANRAAAISIAAAPAPLEDKPKKKRKKRTTEKKEKVEKVYLADGNYLFNEVTYQIFRSGNDKHYFTFKDKDGKTIFLNADVRGFETQEEAQAIVNEIMKYGPYEVNYDGKMARNGKYYFYLKGEEGKNLAKSFFYNSEEDMQASVGLLLGTELQLAAVIAASNKVVDDYLECKTYHGEAGFHRFSHNGEHYFSYNDGDGETVLRSEGYTTEAARENGIGSVISNASLDERWKTGTALDGRYHFFSLKAGNHQEIARSCYYTSEEEMNGALSWVRGHDSTIGKGAQLVDGVWWSAGMLRASQEEEAAALAATEAARVKEEEAARLEAEKAAAAAARLKAEEEAAALAAAEAKRIEEEEDRRRKEKEAALAAAAAAAALAAKQAADAKEEARRKRDAEAAALASRQKADRERIAAATAAAASTVSATSRVEEEPSKPWFRGCLPWLLALLALLLLLWLLRGCFGCDKGTVIPPPVVPVDTIKVEEVPVDTIEAPAPVEPLGLNATEMGFRAGTIEAQLADCLSDPNCDLNQTFNWDGSNYPFNSSKMDKGALPHIDNIAKLMKAYPNAKLDIYGHIDGKESDIYKGPFGDGIITLSGIRARCLYKKLAKRGIDKSRLTFEGFADTRPIAPNDTEAGRIKNRRTEIRISAR